MPLIRNPFRRPVPTDVSTADPTSSPTGTTRPTAIPIPQTEYKLSEINPHGVFLPPSPPAKDTPRFWTTRSTTSTSTSSRSTVTTDDDNPFTISRESFDSYRRSFDISARAPISEQGRHSHDGRFRLPPPRLRDSHVNPPATQPEERFEDVDVGGTDESATKQVKRGSLFARLGASAHQSGEQGYWQGRELFGRRRAQSASQEMGTVGEEERGL